MVMPEPKIVPSPTKTEVLGKERYPPSDKLALTLFWGASAMAIAIALVCILIQNRLPLVVVLLLATMACLIHPILHFVKLCAKRIAVFAGMVAVASLVTVFAARTEEKPEASHAAVVNEKGAKWDSANDKLYPTTGTVIENKGNMVTKGLEVNPPNQPQRVNPPSPQMLLEQLDVLIASSSDLPTWNQHAADFLRENFSAEDANKFSSQPNVAKKRKLLQRYRALFH